MSAPTNGKLLREDCYGRGDDWPSVPADLCSLYPRSESTDVVCARCHSPKGGLHYDATKEQFVHTNKWDCVPGNSSLR